MLCKLLLLCKTQAQFVLAVLVVFVVLDITTICRADDSNETTPAPQQFDLKDDDLDARIERLIRQLGAPTYAVRQSAVEQLWELGPQAQSALERAAQMDDSEVARRASQMLTVLSMGIDKNASPEIARLVLHFHSSEHSVRSEVLVRLLAEKNYQLVYELLGQLENKDDQTQLFEEVLNFETTLTTLARDGNWDDFEFLLGHQLTFEQKPAASVHYHLLNGTLSKKSEELKQRILTNEKDGKTLDDTELTRLIAIFRLQGDYSNAEIFSQKLIDEDRRLAMLNQLLFERGDWVQIAKKMARPEEVHRPEEGMIVVTPSQRALISQYVGDLIEYNNTVQELMKKAQGFEQDNDETGARTVRDTLVQIGMTNLDWKLVLSNFDHENSLELFRIYVTSNRITQALEVIGLGADFEQRNAWFHRRVRNLTSLAAKSQRLYQNNQDNDDVDMRLNETWSNSFQVAHLLGDLGRTDEAVLFYQLLFAELEDENQEYRRFGILQALIQVEQYDVVWKLIETGFDTSDYQQLLNYVFDSQSATARFWYDRLKPRHPDPLTRLKVTSGVVNSPLGTIPEFDLNVELAAALSSSNASRLMDYHLAKVYSLHGDEESSKHHMSAARELGLRNANREFAIEAIQQGEYALALEYFNELAENRSGCFEAALTAEAFRQTGETRQGIRHECLAYAYWRSAYRNTGTIQQLKLLELSHLIRNIFQIETIVMDGSAVSSDRYRDELAISQQVDEFKQGAIQLQLMLYAASSGDLSSRLSSFWADTRKQIDLADAKTKIAAGKYAEAENLLLRYNEYSPGDPDVAEKMIPLLDQAGGGEQASDLFEKMTDVYFEILQEFPNSPYYHNNYAWICVCAKRRTEHMLRHGLIAVGERPNSSSYLDTLASIYFLLGEREQAIVLCRRCIELDPSKQHYRTQLKRFTESKIP